MKILTDKQWDTITEQARNQAEELLKYHDVNDLAQGEIHEQGGEGYEQREHLGSYYTFESHVMDIIEEVTGTADGQVEGYHDFLIELEGWMSDQLPGDWTVYYNEGDIWVARYWEQEEDIPEELQNLIQKY